MDYINQCLLTALICGAVGATSAQDPTTFYFDGSNYVTFKLPNMSTILNISFRAWPETTEGVLFYSQADNKEALTVELNKGSIYKRINFGSPQSGTVRTLSTGSGVGLHDDEEWRDITLTINKKGSVFLIGQFETSSPRPKRIRLGSEVYIGGYAGQTRGIESETFFRGCMSDFVFNGINVFDAVRKSEADTDVSSPFPSECPLIVSYMSFYGLDSYLKIRAEDSPESKLNSISFEFRTFDFNATLLLMDLGATNVSVEFKENSTIVFRTFSYGFGFDNPYPLGFDLGDGEYHKIEAFIDTDGLTVTLDNFTQSDATMKAPRGSDIQAYVIAGFPGTVGYQGCLRELRLNGTRFRVSKLPKENLQNVTLGRCKLIDRCYQAEKRCSHGGKCIRYRDNFSCNCTDTGYKGLSCHTPIYPDSCSDVSIPQRSGQVTAFIDVDGAGPLSPTQVVCSKDGETGSIKTVIRSNAGSAPLRVDGFQDPGSYRYNITYGMEEREAVGIIDRAESCKQYVKYTCNQGRLMSSPDGSSLPFGWWVGRQKTPHYYWGGAPPESRACSCGNVEGGCLGGLPCNCDAQEAFEVSDDGYFTNKTHLPVTQVRFGDTGTAHDTKFASYLVGDVECTGDVVFEMGLAINDVDRPFMDYEWYTNVGFEWYTNVGALFAVLEKTVTIQKLGAYINVSRYLGMSPLDVSLQFKTTIQKAQLLYAEGSGEKPHYLSILMEDPSHVSVRMRFSGGEIDHKEKLPFKLNNNEWQTVYLEMTHKHVVLVVTGRSRVLWTSTSWGFYVHLSTGRPFMIGGNKNGTYGFVGCLRGLVVKGKNVDLTSIVEADKTAGVSTDCVGQCDRMSLCQNGGTCTEYYATYMCDCSTSAFTGCYCGNAVGIRFRVGSWMLFKIQDRLQSSLEYIQLHFKSVKRQGVLAYLSDQRGRAILTIELNLRGGVDISYDSGRGQWGLFTSVDGLADGHPHRVTVRVTRDPSGLTSTWDVEFDDDVQTAESTQARYVPHRLYLASKSSSSASGGFNGCIFGLRYNGVPLLKEVKASPTPDWVSFSTKVSLEENNCGETDNLQDAGSNEPEEPTTDNSRRPVMITSFRSESMGDESSSVVLSHFTNLVCRSLGYPKPRYVIRQDGRHMRCPHLQVDRNTVLLPPDERVDGDYQCLAINDWGKSMSEDVTVAMPRLSEVPAVIEESFFMREGQYLRLKCNVSMDSVPEASTEWSGVELGRNTADRHYQGVDGDLHFLWVLPSDSKVFTCWKVNSELGKRVAVKRIQLQVNSVKDANEYTSKPHEVVFSSPPQMFVDIGKSVVLECLVVGHPTPTVSWSPFDNSSQTSVSKLRGRQLVIFDFTVDKQGEYQCMIDETVMASFMLNMTLKPSWSNGPKPTSVYQDQDAELTCVTNPLPDDATVHTEWFLNGKLLQLKPSYSLNDNGDILTIEKASKLTDIITYQCNVSNQFGYIYGEGFLNVHLGTTIVTSPRDQTISEDRQWASFGVSVSADPGSDVTFTWYHGDEDTSINNSDVYTLKSEATNSQLVVDLTEIDKETEGPQYAGTYRCVIFDEVRKQTVSAELKIEQPSTGAAASGSSGIIQGNSVITVMASLILLTIGQQLVNQNLGIFKFS